MILAGLDLGKVRDPSALVVARKTGDAYRLTRIDEWYPRDENLADVDPIANGCGADALAFDAGGKPGKKVTPRFLRTAVMPVAPLLATHQRKPAEPGDGAASMTESRLQSALAIAALVICLAVLAAI